MDQIRSRAEIARDAENAAERFVATGVDQPNPEIEGSDAHAIWQAHYRRMCTYLLDPTAEGSA